MNTKSPDSASPSAVIIIPSVYPEEKTSSLSESE